VDDPAAGPLARRYRLPPAHAHVLADPDDVRYRAFSGTEIVRAGRWLPELVEAFRTGTAPPALPWAPEGRADSNRAVFLNLLGTQWLPALADVHRRLRREPPARVADLACGPGWSSIAMAQAYPLVRVDGFDLDPDVIAAPASDLERYHYGWSVVSCLPAAMGDPRTSATGAVMRPATLRRYAQQAGFRGMEVLPLETETWRFYRLTP
jgi:SAM-dependent methyltransferase